MSKDDPFISYAQRQTLYHMTGDRYWIEHDDITKEAAGRQFALVRGKKVKNKSKQLQFPDAVDFDNLSFKDQSAVLQEQGNDIKEGKYITSSGRCQQFMYDLRDMLKKDISDEANANNTYLFRETFFNSVELPIWANAVGHIANEEAQHKAILEIIVDVITQKCGSGESRLSDADKAQIKYDVLKPPDRY
jgi:hypothetical protein